MCLVGTYNKSVINKSVFKYRCGWEVKRIMVMTEREREILVFPSVKQTVVNWGSVRCDVETASFNHSSNAS